MANYRGGRINEEVKREVSNIIQNEIKDPRLTAMVSVTDVKVTRDLRYAKVFVSIFGKNDEEKNNTFVALKNASGYIRKEIGQRINLRYGQMGCTCSARDSDDGTTGILVPVRSSQPGQCRNKIDTSVIRHGISQLLRDSGTLYQT